MGGAKDVDSFRENIKANYIPVPETMTCEVSTMEKENNSRRILFDFG